MTSNPLRSSAVPPIALAVAVLALAACGGRHEAPPVEETPPLAVRVALAESGHVGRRYEVAGTVAATTSAAVSSRVAAMVTAVHVDLGDEVRAGQLLLSIDPTAAEGQVAQARGAQAQAEAGLALAQRNFERYQALAATHSASELELDLARTQLDQARGAVEAARGAVDAARSVARESRVVAPFAGRVAARLVDVGDLAAPGRPLVMIESTRGRRLVVSVPETLARGTALATGAAIAVTLDAALDRGEIAGRVAEISPGPDPGSHSYTVKIDLPLADVPAGAAGRAYFPAPAGPGQRDAVRVPRAALIESGGLTLIVVRNAESRAESRVVTVGAIDGDGRAEILSGLAGGENVVIGLAGSENADSTLAAGGAVGTGLTTAPAAGRRLEVRP